MHISKTQTEALIVGGIAFVSFSAGSALTYIYAKRTLETKFNELLGVEIEEAKRFYRVLYKQDELSTPGEAVRTLIGDEQFAEAAQALRSYSPEMTAEEERAEEALTKPAKPTERNIFVADPADWDYEYELSVRNPLKPYIITEEEYLEAEPGFDQTSLTYFEEDDVLIDDRDQPVTDHEKTCGSGNLLRFGHGSKNNNVVYVRNETLQLDMEIMRSTGSYAREVLGFIDSKDDTLEHSARRPRRGERG